MQNSETQPAYLCGSVNIPFWINKHSLDVIKSVEHRNILIGDIKQQASLWNLCKMHDGNGDLFNFYEVGVNLTIKPDKIDGREVLEILVQPGDYAGDMLIKLDKLKLIITKTLLALDREDIMTLQCMKWDMF